MKKLKIVLSVLALGLLILCGSLMSSSFNAADLGSIHVEVVDLDKTIISQKEISYEELLAIPSERGLGMIGSSNK